MSSTTVIIDVEHVARRTVQGVLTACLLSATPPSSVWVIHNKNEATTVSLPLSEELLKLPLHFVRLPDAVTRAKDSAVYVGGYLASLGNLQDVVLVSSRGTCFTSEVLGCGALTTVRNAEELSVFASSIGVDMPVAQAKDGTPTMEAATAEATPSVAVAAADAKKAPRAKASAK